jgi:hypothetical protein
VTASSSPLPRLSEFLVRLERLERSQRPGVFLVDRLTAAPGGVMLMSPSGVEVVIPVDVSMATIVPTSDQTGTRCQLLVA